MLLYSTLYFLCPEQDVKSYPSGVRFDKRKVLRALGPRNKHF